MNYKLSNKAIKDAKKLPERTRFLMKEAFKSIKDAKNVNDIQHCIKMKGAKNAYRVRVLKHRIGFYLIDEELFVFRILNRKEIYKKFP